MVLYIFTNRVSTFDDIIFKSGPQMLESLSTEWTDEKHSLYLNFIEAAFVKQLNNQDNHLRDLHVRLYRKQKVLNPNSSHSKFQ